MTLEFCAIVGILSTIGTSLASTTGSFTIVSLVEIEFSACGTSFDVPFKIESSVGLTGGTGSKGGVEFTPFSKVSIFPKV